MTKYIAMAGDYILMMSYTTVGGRMMLYFFKTPEGDFGGLDSEAAAGEFSNMLANPVLMGGFIVIVVLLYFGVCAMGPQKGVERIIRVMMVCLLVLMVVLAVHSMVLPGGGPGLEFYLKPNFGKMMEVGIGEAVFAALGQSFFTLSIGIEALAIFGSYIGKERTLTGEAVSVTLPDALVAFMTRFTIFPACFAYNIESTTGPSLIFIALPNIFNHMAGGRIWGALFFLFMSFAAFPTTIAAFRNIISFATGLTGCTPKKAVLCNIAAIVTLSVPCVLGFNLWGSLAPLGKGSTVLGLEGFTLNNNLLPIGSMLYLLFCTSRYGWGSKKFTTEANEGEGIHFPVWARICVSYTLPLIVLIMFIQGYVSRFMSN